jgi:hypothetical protein
VAPAWRASTRLTSVTPPWKRSTSAKTSTRLQVASTIASLTWSLSTSSCSALTRRRAHRELLEQRHRRGLVAHAHREQAHASSPALPAAFADCGGTRTLVTPAPPRRLGPLLLAEEGQHLQLDGEVDLADVDPGRAR